MKLRLLILLITCSFGANAQWTSFGTGAIQRQIVGSDTTYRWVGTSLGTYLYGQSLWKQKQLFAPISGSANYVQISPLSQQSGNINIGGSGTFGGALNIGGLATFSNTTNLNGATIQGSTGDFSIADRTGVNGNINFQYYGSLNISRAGQPGVNIDSGKFTAEKYVINTLPSNQANPTQVLTRDASNGVVKYAKVDTVGGLASTNYAVKKSGDIMTGDLTTAKLTAQKVYTGDSLSNRNLYVIGTSITGIGFGNVTNIDSVWAVKLAKKIGFNPILRGLPGRALQQITTSDSSGYSKRNDVINYTNGSFYAIELQINDAERDSSVYTPTIYEAQLNAMIDAAVAKGWPTSNIILVNTAYYNPVGFPSSPNIENRHDQYYAKQLAVSVARGTLLYDGYYSFKSAYLLDNTILDGLQHPNNSGHTIIANAMYSYLLPYVTPVDLTVEINKVFGSSYVSGNLKVDGVSNLKTINGTDLNVTKGSITSTLIDDTNSALTITTDGSTAAKTYKGVSIITSHTSTGAGGAATGLTIQTSKSSTGIYPVIGANITTNTGARASGGTAVTHYGLRNVINGSTATSSTATNQTYVASYNQAINTTPIGEGGSVFAGQFLASGVATNVVTGASFSATGGSSNIAANILAGTVRFTPLTASLPLKLNASKDVISAAIDLSGSEVTNTLTAAKGGTGISSYTAGNYINAATSTTLQQRTPAQVLSDIGAASTASVALKQNLVTLTTTGSGAATFNQSTGALNIPNLSGSFVPYTGATTSVDLGVYSLQATGVVANLANFEALRLGTNAISTNTTLLSTTLGYTHLVDATSGNITINLPAASSVPSRNYVFKKIDASANTVTIDPNGSELIDGSLTKVITTQYKFITLQCNGVQWYIIGEN